MWTRRSERGIAAFEEAIKLNPSFAAAHVMLGQMYVYAGRREEAIELAETGIRLSPTDPRLDRWLPALAGAHYQMRHYAAAIEAGRRSWSLNRNWPHGLRYVVAGLAQLGGLHDPVEAEQPNPFGFARPGLQVAVAADQQHPDGVDDPAGQRVV